MPGNITMHKEIVHELLRDPNARQATFRRSLLENHRFRFYVAKNIRKRSHKARIKSAYRVLLLLNGSAFRFEPGRFFAYVRKLDPFTFEELILLTLKARNLSVRHNRAYTGDGGVDGAVMLPQKGLWAIQAKCYSCAINPAHVRDFASMVANRRFAGGLFIHTGRTGDQSYKACSGNIVFLSGHKLHELISQAI